MGPDGVIVPPPLLDYDLGLVERIENFAIQQVVAKLGTSRYFERLFGDQLAE